jgi:tetratricopeptide (TPR) repeat protein
VGAAYLGGILSKEMAITFPLACLILHFLRRRADIRAALKENWKLYALLGVVTLGLLAKVLQHNWGETVGGSHLPFTRWEYLLTQVNLVARYIGVFLLPLPSWLCADWDYRVVRSLLDPRFLVSAAFWLAVAGGLWLSWRKRGEAVLFAVTMYLLAGAPTSSVIPIADPLMEYRVYVPAIFLTLGLAALLALAADRAWPREATRRRATALAAVLLTGMLVAHSLWLRERLSVYRSAEAFWSDAARKSPRKPRPVYNLAVVHFRLGRLAEAVAGFREVLRLEPENVDALCQLGDIHRDAGDTRAAKAMYLQALRIKPRSHQILNKICYLWIQDGQYERAFEQLARVPDQSKDVGYYLNYAIYFSRTGQLEQALSMYKYVLRLDPHNAVAWTNLGNLCRRSGDPQAAEGCYLKALSIEPDYYLAHFNLGRLCLEGGRVEEALTELEAARRANPRFADADFETGNVLASSRRYAQAEEYYRRFLAVRPGHAEGWYRLGLVLQELGRPSEAAGCFQAVLRLDPGRPDRDQISRWAAATR